MFPSTPVGLLVGGRGLRMGGVKKPLMTIPGSGQRVLERLVEVVLGAGLSPVLIGADQEYAQDFGELPMLYDDPSGIGPMGGLGALLAHAADSSAIMLAGDMPYVTEDLLRRLARASSEAPVLAARDPDSGKWYPFFARYDAPRVLPQLRTQAAEGVRSFQTLFRELQVSELPLMQHERALLRDWDRPGDVV